MSLRDLHHHIPAYHGLATESRVQGQSFRGVQAVLLVLLKGRQVILPFPHDDVTGGAGAAPAAVVLEVHVVGQGDVEDRARATVIGEWIFRVIDLDGDIEREEGHLVRRHQGSLKISSARREAMAPLRAASIMASARRSVAWLSSVVRSRITSRSVPPSTSCRAAMARSMAWRSSGWIRCAAWASARCTWFSTVSASVRVSMRRRALTSASDRKSTRLNSSHLGISYAV